MSGLTDEEGGSRAYNIDQLFRHERGRTGNIQFSFVPACCSSDWQPYSVYVHSGAERTGLNLFFPAALFRGIIEGWRIRFYFRSTYCGTRIQSMKCERNIILYA